MKRIVIIATLILTSCRHGEMSRVNYELEVQYLNGEKDTITHVRDGFECWLEFEDECLGSVSNNKKFYHVRRTIACGVRKYKVLSKIKP